MSTEDKFESIPFEPIFGQADPNICSIAIPPPELEGRISVTLSTLARWAIQYTPEDFPYQRILLAERIDSYELCPPSRIMAFGPFEGDYYVELPATTPGTQADGVLE